MTKQSYPVYADFYKGITLSKKIQSGFDDLQGVNVHDELGSLTCQYALEHKDGGVITEPCYQGTALNGDTYFFSQTSGKIWKRTQAGVYSFVRTNPNGAHKGAQYYRNYMYYATDTKLGRFDFASTWTDSYQTLNSLAPHPMNNSIGFLYIGNGPDIAFLDNTDTFSTSVLAIPIEYSISAMTTLGDDLLSICNVSDYIHDGAIFRWDRFSDQANIKDSVKETQAYAFIDADNDRYVVCNSGHIYHYNGTELNLITMIRNPYGTAGHQLTTNLKGKPLVANGGRIYSFYRKNPAFPMALVGEYTCSQGEDATINSITANGSNLLVSWTKGGNSGVDEISSSFTQATIITPHFGKFNNVSVFYDDLNGATVQIFSKIDEATDWTEHEVYDDSSDLKVVRTADDMIIDNGAQAKIVITPATTSPIISKIVIS